MKAGLYSWRMVSLTDPALEKIKAERFQEMQERLGKKEVNEVEIEVTDANFRQEVIEKSKSLPVVVDFWASWCMPCLTLGPVLEKLAKKFDGRFVLAKANVDKNQATSAQYAVSSIPSVKFFKNGQITDEFVGVLPEEQVEQWLQKNL